MRDFGILKGPDLVPILSTLVQEGALDKDEVLVLRAVNQDLGNNSELYFRSGYCIHAFSSDYAYRLEQLLYKKRLLERAQLDELEHTKKQNPQKSLVQLIIEKTWISENELALVIAHLTEIVAYEILLWQGTAFSLGKSRKPEAEMFGLGLDISKLMSAQSFSANADKNLPVLVLMREKLSNLNMILRRQQELNREQLSDYQYHAYRFVNNRNSIRELLQLSELGYFDTFTALFQLISWDYIGMGKLDVPRYQRKAPPTAKDSSTPPAEKSPVTQATPSAQNSANSDISKELEPLISGPAPTSGQRQFLRRCRGSELLQILVSVLKSGYQDGKLVIDNQSQIVRCELTMHRGNLVHASTTATNIRFGDLLVKKELIDSVQLREALEEQKSSTGKRLGEILIRHGLLDEQTIPRLIYHQMECAIYETLAWPDAKFYFEAADKIQQDEVLVDAHFDIQDGRLVREEAGQENENNARNILQEADKNLPILLMIREKMPDSRSIPYLVKESVTGLSEDQKYVLNQINGVQNIHDLLIASKLNYFQTYTSLFQLFSTGVFHLHSPDEAGKINTKTALRSHQLAASPRPQNAGVTVKRSTQAKPAENTQNDFELTNLLGLENIELLKHLPEHKYEAFRRAVQAILQLSLN